MNQSIYKSTKRECEKPTSPDTNNSVQCDDKVTIVIEVEGQFTRSLQQQRKTSLDQL